MNIHFGRVQRITANLEYYYLNFWKHIYYDDSKVYYKNAILFYKNNENGKNHNFFSGYISSFLYKGNCEYLQNENKKSFSNANMIPSSDDLCRLIKMNINILDEIFTISPKLPLNIITFRTEIRDKNEELCKLKKNAIIQIPNYWSTTISPYYGWNSINKITIKFIINLPKNTKCYYMNNPFFIDDEYKYNSKYLKGINESEILLPRNCVYKIIKKIKVSNTIIYVIDLVKQLENTKVTDEYIIPDFIVSKKEIKIIENKIIENKIKNKHLELINEKINFIKYKTQQNINNKKIFNFADLIYSVKYETIHKDISYINKIKNNKTYISFIENIKSAKLKSKFIFLKYDIDNIKQFNYIKKLKLNTNYKFNKIFVFQDNELSFNNEILQQRFYLYKSDTFKNTSKITQKDLANNLFKIVDTEPIYYILKLHVKKKFEYYELFDTEKINLHNKFTLKINSKIKHNINNFHYYILNGTLS
jgi:hypothetical protein